MQTSTIRDGTFDVGMHCPDSWTALLLYTAGHATILDCPFPAVFDAPAMALTSEADERTPGPEAAEAREVEAQQVSPDAERCVVSWTGGKDCNLALLAAWREASLNVIGLVVFRPEAAVFRAHPLPLMEAQAAALRLPLHHIVIPRDAPSYKEAYCAGIRGLRDAHGVRVIATGDMDLVGTMQRNWIEECGEECGVRAFLPLWMADRAALLRQLRDEGFEVIFSCVKSPWFDRSWVTRTMDAGTLAELMAMAEQAAGGGEGGGGAAAEGQPKALDLGGERGEYHTMCLDGPLYAQRVRLAKAEPVELIEQPGQKAGERWWTLGAVNVLR